VRWHTSIFHEMRNAMGDNARLATASSRKNADGGIESKSGK
jgi:hypothetical protein